MSFMGMVAGRRELLRIGGMSILGASIGHRPQPAKASELPASGALGCIFILLQGGASHHDLWDPKPLATPEIRGPFPTIETRIPELNFGELLPRSAAVADHLCVIRSMTHKFTNHIAGTYITLTGSNNQPDRDREAHDGDFPGPGAVLNFLHRGSASIPASLSVPNWLSIPGPSNRMPGQYGGFLGSTYDPFLIEGDPNQPNYQPFSLTLPDGLNADRMAQRLDLVHQMDRAAGLLERELNRKYDQVRQDAYDLVVSGVVRRALDLNQESPALRDRYGRTKFGQSLLLARRLIEAGVKFVAYNSFNQEWDTHGNLFRRYQEIVPPMDRAFGTLVEDLADRNLLSQTLVINTGEFGRTPQVNKEGGRDHWPNVYSTVLAGGGIRGGMVFGASDSKGAEVADHPVQPCEILATLYRQLCINPALELRDRLNRPLQLSEGRVLHEILG